MNGALVPERNYSEHSVTQFGNFTPESISPVRLPFYSARLEDDRDAPFRVQIRSFAGESKQVALHTRHRGHCELSMSRSMRPRFVR